jgi:tetratricopeptide (TPR) repeat protein
MQDQELASVIQQNGIAFPPTTDLLASLKKINYYYTILVLEAIRGPEPAPEPNNVGKENQTPRRAGQRATALRYRQQRRPEEDRTEASSNPNVVTILVADFDGVDPQKYRLTEHILQGLHVATSGDSYIRIQSLGSPITEQMGSEYARNIGIRHGANIILWGYYGASPERADISVYVQVLRVPKCLSLRGNLERLNSPIGNFDKYLIQNQVSGEMTYLVLLTAGLARYESGDYEGAIDRLKKALPPDAPPNVPEQMINPEMIYLYLGLAYYHKAGRDDIDKAIAYYDQAISHSNNQDAEAFYNRGDAYARKGQYDLAKADYAVAVQLRPSYAEAISKYNVLGNLKRIPPKDDGTKIR